MSFPSDSNKVGVLYASENKQPMEDTLASNKVIPKLKCMGKLAGLKHFFEGVTTIQNLNSSLWCLTDQ